MKCPFCGLLVNEKLGIPNCPHCGSSIFHGVDAYSGSGAGVEIKARLDQGKPHDLQAPLEQGGETQGRESEQNEVIVEPQRGRFQLVLESMGMAALYSMLFTLITSPILYWLIQPHFLQSYSTENLLAGSFLFYFIFGFIVFLVTPRFLPE
jgi:hypothetical protein